MLITILLNCYCVISVRLLFNILYSKEIQFILLKTVRCFKISNLLKALLSFPALEYKKRNRVIHFTKQIFT